VIKSSAVVTEHLTMLLFVLLMRLNLNECLRMKMDANEKCEWKMWMKNVNEWDENVILFEWSDGACQW
jgi:hypothetical protein